MLEYMMLIIAFVGLYLSIIWINLLFLGKDEIEEKKSIDKSYRPTITFAIPAYNEEKTIAGTIQSILDIDYPKGKYEIIVVDDGSTDNTAKIAKQYEKDGVKVIKTKNHGKGHALNIALKRSKKELFTCVDADSYIEKESVMIIVQNFRNKKVSGCSSSIFVKNNNKIIEKMQVFEYMYAAIFRKLFAFIGCLFVTPGVLSIYRTEDLKEAGMFEEDRNNITEDLEIAMRLQSLHKCIAFDIQSITYTTIPDTMKKVIRQRIRWFRGYIYNARKYRHMHLNKDYELLGLFILPLNIASVIIIISSTIIIWSGILDGFKYIYQKAIIAKTPLYEFIDILTLKQIILTIDFKISIPLTIITLAGLYLLYKSHKITGKSIDISARSIIAFILFLVIYPWLLALCWTYSLILEAKGSKREW